MVECGLFTWLGLKMGIKEQKLKRKYNVNVDLDDFNFTLKHIVQLLCIGVLGGLLSGALGLGGAVIYNPALMTLGFHA